MYRLGRQGCSLPGCVRTPMFSPRIFTWVAMHIPSRLCCANISCNAPGIDKAAPYLPVSPCLATSRTLSVEVNPKTRWSALYNSSSASVE